jgi:predicted transcriptional regulator
MTTQARVDRAAREQLRLGELAELGIDSPLKLDLVARLMAEPAHEFQVASLAARAGKSVGAVRHALEELAQHGFVRHERFYNRETSSFAADPALALRLVRLIGRTSAARRELRFALLASRG